jgi:hypothetical protein
MKTMKFHVTVLTSLLMSGMLNAQVVVDPIENVYRIGSSSELFIAYTVKDGTHANHGVLDVSTELDSFTEVEELYESGHLDRRKTASATGDFNGDGANNVATVTANESGEIRISIPLMGEDQLINEVKVKEYDLSLTEQDYTRIRIIAGNFDADPQDEFALCYDLPDGLVIRIFKTDQDLNIEQIASFEGITRYDRNFDIAAGDMDKDGIDEIVLVKNKAMPYRKTGSSPPIFISTYDLYTLKYNKVTQSMTMQKKWENMLTENPVSEHNFYPNKGRIINEMRITCGDLNNDGMDEVIIGWSFYYNHYQEIDVCVDRVLGVCVKYESYYYYQNVTFLNTFTLTGDSIENYQNISMPRDYFGQRGVSADQHIAMTLTFKQMDNLGKPVVLINSATRIYGFEKDGNDMLTKKAEIGPLSEHHLNIQGNETFAVSDLNPDTTALNFKEVIILQSDKTPLQQIGTRHNGKTSMAVASIDNITEDKITFNDPGPLIDFPFGSGENIEITAFHMFSWDDVEFFVVGTPVITRVEDLQQPIIILNSPPVHFDVFDGEIFDLCNAYAGGEPAFHATYITTIDQQKTTSVNVDKGFGFSSDIRAYAMAGGSGFEAAVNANWEKGSSFYQASSQNTTIEDKIKIQLEDYVLYSYLDYDYYKYPVFNLEGEKLGEIAVLNPVSPFSSALRSANDWTHPSFVLNHEPGNIFSYKQKINSQDFSTIPSDFIYTKFPSVPVATSVVNRTFAFTFDHISSGAESYSYSGGVGASLFMKAGIEITVQASLAPLGIGGNVSSDVRMGVSSDLSAYYHNSTLSTHSTELSNAFRIEGTIGMLDPWFNESAKYYIAPYIYRSQSGALVLDYIVDIPNMGWWEKHYSTNPDLAFILPWRYATEKGVNVTVSRKQKTSDIQFYPPIASPGDTVAIIARVHNFSLKTFDGLLNVDFYLDDPVDGGVKLTDIYGVSGSSKHSLMKYGNSDAPEFDREEFLTFMWKVPDTVSCSPRIYAVIDPDNVYTEIHKSNNVGWNMLNIYNCQDCIYVERFTSTQNLLARQLNFTAYPNPFSSHCQIRFSLPQPETVQIDLYNLSGHKVATIANEMYGSGEHEVSVNAENLGNGVYFCRITAGAYSEIIKLILVR